MTTRRIPFGGGLARRVRDEQVAESAAVDPLGLLTGRLGWIPLLSVTAAVGLLTIAVAFSASRGAPDPGRAAPLAFWAGILLIVVPIAFRLVRAAPTRTERLGLVLLAGLAMYVVKVLHDPLYFTFFDEFLHTRTADDILETKHLFTPNTMLLASSYYPGLENVVTAVVELSGVSVFEAGMAVLAGVRVLFVIALFVLFQSVSRSSRLAGIATLAYAANPSFIYFSAQFAYESLALPLVVLALYLVLRRQRSMDPPAVSAVLIVLVVGATVVTHHVSSMVLCAVLVVWTGIHWLGRGRMRFGISPLKPAIFTIGATLAWLFAVATVTVGYLAPAIELAALEVVRLVAGQSSARELFRVSGAPVQPVWEIVAGYAAVALILLTLPYGLWRIWRRTRRFTLALTLAVVSLGYPAALVARFTERGAEISARTTTFVFIGVAFVVATTFVRFVPLVTERVRAWRRGSGGPAPSWPVEPDRAAVLGSSTLARTAEQRAPGPPHTEPSRVVVSGSPHRAIRSWPRLPWERHRTLTAVALTAAFAVLFVGGIVVAVPPWARLPGSYLVGADTRSIEPIGIAAAEWTRAYLGPENRFMVDRTNRLLQGTIGEQHPVTASGDRVNIRPAFFATQIGPAEIGVLRAGEVRYALVDRRLSTALPLVGVYVERGEVRTGRRTVPIDAAALGKFDRLEGVSRLYDSGVIQIYDIEVLTDAGVPAG